jgi:hypothetical protein
LSKWYLRKEERLPGPIWWGIVFMALVASALQRSSPNFAKKAHSWIDSFWLILLLLVRIRSDPRFFGRIIGIFRTRIRSILISA